MRQKKKNVTEYSTYHMILVKIVPKKSRKVIPL